MARHSMAETVVVMVFLILSARATMARPYKTFIITTYSIHNSSSNTFSSMTEIQSFGSYQYHMFYIPQLSTPKNQLSTPFFIAFFFYLSLPIYFAIYSCREDHPEFCDDPLVHHTSRRGPSHIKVASEQQQQKYKQWNSTSSYMSSLQRQPFVFSATRSNQCKLN